VLQKYADTTKTRYEIPEGTTEIAKGAFSLSNPNGDILEEIVLPSSLRKIGSFAFQGRTALKTIRLPEGIERIETHTFDQCISLNEFYIPASVNFISPFALPFYKRDWSRVFSPQLSTIEVNENNESFKSVDGILYSKDGKTLIQVPTSHSISVFEAPEALEEIGENAFCGIQTLKKVILHSGVTRIGKNAFYRCESLEEAIVNAQEIGDYAFFACEKLNRLSLKQTKIIGKNAFEECLQLGNIALPDGLTQIGERAFKDCGMTDITVPKTVLKTENESFSGCPRITVYDTIDPEAKPCEEFLDDVNGYPNSTVGFIGIGPSWAIWQCAANHRWVNHEIIVRSAETDEIKYKIPMVSDPKQRMYYCTLTSSWGKNATFHFAALDNIFSKIKGVTIKINVALTRLRYPVNLSDSQKKIYENYLVRSAKDLVSLCVDSDDMETLILCEPFGILKKDNIDALIDYAAKANAVTFSAYLMNYKNEKFGFIEPKLPSLSFKEPELWAFSKSNPGKIGRYKGLETEITFPSEWKGSPVTGVASTTSKVPENYLAITSVVLPEGYTSIGDYAFYGCENLEKITLPSTLQTIGKEAFHGCKKLKEIIMPDSLTTIGENAFSYCSALEKVRFSEDITQIPEYAFYCCNQLEEVDLPESVQWIEKGCFESIGLKKLTVRCKHLYANGKCFGSKPEVYVYHKDAVKDVYGIAKRSVQVIGEEKASKEGTSSRKNSGLWEFSSVDSITFQDKIFVLSGFGADEEAKITEKIQSLGGIVKSSTVVKTDYLIVMEEYNRVTTKYQKAKELQAQGKNLAIISSATFYSLIQ
ncbi:MAG: leucine-rich repeat protein, partial [Clostridia bacterium]|nr:leucine-rich repeat protein [Clostridia bacterium]